MVAAQCSIAAITCGAQGSVVAANGERHAVPAAPAQVVDTTGAGDLYAAGFLSGYTRGRPLATCGALGSLAAAEVISHLGARPATSLHAIAGELGT
jgi:sugar/nucleoside kinase (ribokinase family)